MERVLPIQTNKIRIARDGRSMEGLLPSISVKQRARCVKRERENIRRAPGASYVLTLAPGEMPP